MVKRVGPPARLSSEKPARGVPHEAQLDQDVQQGGRISKTPPHGPLSTVRAAALSVHERKRQSNATLQQAAPRDLGGEVVNPPDLWSRDSMPDIRFQPSCIRYPVPVPPTTSREPSVFAFSIHKAGSTLLYDVLRELSRVVGLTYYSIPDHLFQENVGSSRRPDDIGQPFRQSGFCYGGFREFPAFPVPLLDSARIAFLVRDPRDMITSLYFSIRHSHSLPPPSTNPGVREELLSARSRLERLDIDAFGLETAYDYVRKFEGYIAQGFHWRTNVATYRYEDVIFKKRIWIDHLCSWFGWDIPSDFKDSVAARFDIVVDVERPDQHIRQVKPGNHRRHLRKETIDEISQVLAEPLRMYGYE
ncbi:MAG: hypothetical protein ABWY12_00385 [Burkholderiales bacterium]